VGQWFTPPSGSFEANRQPIGDGPLSHDFRQPLRSKFLFDEIEAPFQRGWALNVRRAPASPFDSAVSRFDRGFSHRSVLTRSW
jgi:hypothetical protein